MLLFCDSAVYTWSWFHTHTHTHARCTCRPDWNPSCLQTTLVSLGVHSSPHTLTSTTTPYSSLLPYCTVARGSQSDIIFSTAYSYIGLWARHTQPHAVAFSLPSAVGSLDIAQPRITIAIWISWFLPDLKLAIGGLYHLGSTLVFEMEVTV